MESIKPTSCACGSCGGNAIHENACKGLQYMQSVTGKTRITPGDVLERFTANNALDVEHVDEIFCLTITLLEQYKSQINETGEGNQEKIMAYVLETFVDRLP